MKEKDREEKGREASINVGKISWLVQAVCKAMN